jgi:hypothetical protein
MSTHRQMCLPSAAAMLFKTPASSRNRHKSHAP